MLLYLRNESLYRIDTIELVDGCSPRITYDVGTFGSEGIRSPPPTEEYTVLDLNIEPAIWGIILILDRVCVDIKRRRFSWATTSVGKLLDDDEGTEDPSIQTHYANDERYEYDDNVDELFNLADYLIAISHSRSKSIRDSHEEQSSLIRMLYCCILPKILLYHKDQKKVEEAIRNQMSYIRKLEHDIERDSQVLDDLYKVVCKQQDERLQQFESIAAMKRCSKTFVKIIHADLEKRQNQLREQIDENQGTVQQIKDDIEKNGPTDEKKKQLEEARKRTAHVHKILQRVLIASADTIKESLESEGFQMDDNEEVVVDYLTSKEMFEKQKTVAKCHMEKKVRATSVQENLKRIKEDLAKDDGVATATITSHSGARPTDVIISDAHVPEYQTLSERVAAIVKNPEHPYGEQFAKFTKYVRESCQEILEGAESSSGNCERRKKKTPKFENGYLLVDIDGALQEEFLTPLEKLCEEIKIHCDSTALLFLEQFNSLNSDVLKCKLQLCYEENFYIEVGSDIMKVYEMAYKKRKEKLIHDLSLLSTYPINCLNLGMKDEWWLRLFEKRRQATLAKRRSLSCPIPDRSRNRNTLSSDSCTPPESEDSSTTSSSSRSSIVSSKDNECTQFRPNGRTSSKEVKKRSPSTIGRKLIGMLRRTSKEVLQAESGEDDRSSMRSSKSDSCYDDYDTYKAKKMSGEIEVTIPESSYTNNEDYVSNGIETSGNNSNVSLGKTNRKDSNGIASSSSEDHAIVSENHKNGSEDSMIHDQTEGERQRCDNELSKFAKYFGPSLDSLKDVFHMSSVFGKLKCLTKSLTKVTDAVQELRQQVLDRVDENNEFCMAITADDLLPLMVLIMLQMDSSDTAAIVVELKAMQDLIPKFLSFGCHGWALVEFDMASKVLQSLCNDFDWTTTFSTSA